MNNLAPEMIDAIHQFAARFADQDAGPMQQELARFIEQAIADFKATELQHIMRRVVRAALADRIKAAVDVWSSQYDRPQPLKEDAA